MGDRGTEYSSRNRSSGGISGPPLALSGQTSSHPLMANPNLRYMNNPQLL